MAVSNVSATSNADLIARLNGTDKTKDANASSDLQDRFMAVLLAQLKNQDPLNPMDNAQMTSQLAQISTVEGITKMNASLSGISEVFSSGQMLQAAGLVGHQVMAAGDNLDLASGQSVAGVKLDGAADRVSVQVFNSSGAQVATLELGRMAAGYHDFAWDGLSASGAQLADGQYRFSVSASNQGESVAATAYALGRVGSVTSGSNGISIQLQSGDSVQLSQVQSIF